MFFFIKNFIKRKLELFQYEAIKVVISIMTEIFMNFFFLLLGVMILFSGSLALSFFLSYYFGNYVVGFGIITILYLFLFFFIFFFCKDIIRFFIKNSFFKVLKK